MSNQWPPGGGGYPPQPDPTRPIRTGLDPRQPHYTPEPPPPSKAPLIIVGAVALALVITLSIAAVNVLRADQASGPAASPSPARPSRSALGPNQQRFTTNSCESGIMGVESHERIGRMLYIEVKITCEKGEVSIADGDFAIFDRNAEALENQVPDDRQTFGDQTLSDGQSTVGWTSFINVPDGEVTLLFLGFSRTIAAVPIET